VSCEINRGIWWQERLRRDKDTETRKEWERNMKEMREGNKCTKGIKERKKEC
jgi:hypothetical protein